MINIGIIYKEYQNRINQTYKKENMKNSNYNFTKILMETIVNENEYLKLSFN